MKMRDLKRSAYKAMHQAMAESREVGKAQERERIMNLLNANSENSVNGNSEIPETASNSPDTNLNVTAATQDYFAGMTRGRIEERERIIKLLEPEVARHYQLGLDASAAYLEQKIALIKDETRNITSEILPDGTIYIEEVKGEQK